MGFFDKLVDIVEEATKDTVETVVRLPEVGVRVIKGGVDGAEKGAGELEKLIDDLLK
jgi:hypothetical protein